MLKKIPAFVYGLTVFTLVGLVIYVLFWLLSSTQVLIFVGAVMLFWASHEFGKLIKEAL